MAKWLDWLKMARSMTATFQEFSTAFKNWYFPLDNANIAYDKLCTLM